MDEEGSSIDLKQKICFNFSSELKDLDAMSHSNQSNLADIRKKYMIYMEVPKILIGDFRKSSCVSGSLIRFHFLIRIAHNEENTVLRLMPITVYKVPVVNIAVIHRPFLDDDSAKGPIPKSPSVRSPLIDYRNENVENASQESHTDESIAEEFRTDRSPRDIPQRQHSGQFQTSQSGYDGNTHQEQSEHRRNSQSGLDKGQRQQRGQFRTNQSGIGDAEQKQSGQFQTSQSENDDNAQQEQSEQGLNSQSGIDNVQQKQSGQFQTSQSEYDENIPQEHSEQRQNSPSGLDNVERKILQGGPSKSSLEKTEQSGFSQASLKSPSPLQPFESFESKTPVHYQDGSSARIQSVDTTTAQTMSTNRRKKRRPKKYFVYCEVPKVLIGEFRKSSVVCSKIIHAHFLIKIARDEDNEQPTLRPIKRYHRPRANFAVIHKSLLVDDDAIGPIPCSPNVRSPMIREDIYEDDVMYATIGFCYGQLPRSKYELATQWSLVRDKNGGPPRPELVLSKAEA